MKISFKSIIKPAKIIAYSKTHWKKTACFAALLLIITFSAICIINHSPKLLLATVDFYISKITFEDNKLLPQNVEIVFSENLKPLELEYNKTIPIPIKISPATKGQWVWIAENKIKFSPNQNLSPNKEYTVSFNKKTFKPNHKLASLTHTFKTQPLLAQISNLRLYENPLDLKEKKIVAQINFNYPIQRQDLEKKLSLKLDQTKLDFELQYAQADTVVYLHSAAVPIREQESFVYLELNKIKDASQSASLNTPAKQNVRIPNIENYFRVADVKTSILRNKQKNDEPEQVLLLTFTSPVKAEDLRNKLLANLIQTTQASCSYNNLKEIDKKHLVSKSPLPLTLLPNEDEYSKVYAFKFDLPETKKMCLEVIIAQGLVSQDEFSMSKDWTGLLNISPYPLELKIAFDGAILSASGTKELTFLSRGLSELQVEIYKIDTLNINNLISQTYGSLKNPNFSNYNFNQNNLAQLFSKNISLLKQHPAQANYSALNLSQYFENQKGLFIIDVYAYDPQTNTKLTHIKDRRLIMLTDIGVLAKQNYADTYDVFVASIKSGTPLAKAKVQVLGLNGLEVTSKLTDPEGHVAFQQLASFKGPQKPIAFVVTNGSDVSFIPLNRSDNFLNFTKFEVDGNYETATEDKVLVHLWTDRDLYRPGETIQVASLVRTSNFKVPTGIPLEVVLTDPLGKEINTRHLSVSEDGLFEFSLETKSEYQTGIYNFYVYLIKGSLKSNYRDRYLGYKAIKLEQFVPDNMKINVVLEDEKNTGWSQATVIKGMVTLTNLFGTAAQNRMVKQNFSLAPTNFIFKAYPDWNFTDALRNPKSTLKEINESLPVQTTNEFGTTKFEINLADYTRGTYSLNLYSEGFEAEGGRAVVHKKTFLISPLAYIVGFKANGKLDYIKKDSQRSVEFIALNSEVQNVTVANISAVLVEKKNTVSLIQQADGTFGYQTVQHESVLEKNTTAIPQDKPLKIALPTAKPGEFALRLEDCDGNIISKVDYLVAGSSNLDFALDKEAELDLRLNQTEYKNGETIEMQITTPYSGYGLITIERESVFAFKWFKTEAKSTLQTITVPQNLSGNAYVNVSFIRDFDSKEIFMSPISYAVSPFKINLDHKKQSITLSGLPERVRPSETLEIKYQTAQPSSLILYGVDEGILQVARYKLPKPLETFFAKLALQVQTFQIMHLIMPEFRIVRELMAAGGDEALEMSASSLNPFARKDYQPVVFWSGVLKASSEVQTYKYQVPDYFNGQLRIMAVASNATSIGSTEKNVYVHGDFILTPNYPTHVAPGDEFIVSLNVSNQLKGSGDMVKIMVKATADDKYLELVENTAVWLEINEGSEKIVTFKARAKNQLGAGSLTFVATNQDSDKLPGKPAKISTVLSVRPAAAYQNEVLSGYEKKTISLNNFALNLFSAYRKQVINVSTSPLILAQGLLQYLEEFPYLCSEQITSKVFAAIMLAHKYPALFEKDGLEKLQNLYQDTINILQMRQVTSGGFAAWNNYGVVDKEHSVYALHFLTEAQRLNYSVPKEMLNEGVDWLKQLVGETPSNLESARLTGYGIYVLTLNEIVTTNYLLHLVEYLETNYQDIWQSDLVGAYIAASYKLLQDEQKAERIIKKYVIVKEKSGDNGFDSDFGTGSLRNAKYYYLVGKHFPLKISTLQEKGIENLLAPLKNRDYNTLLSANSILALTVLSDDLHFSDTITFKTTSQTGKEVTLEKSVKDLVSDFEFDTSVQKVEISASKPLYYNVVQQGFSKTLPSQAEARQVEIFKEYLDQSGNVVQQANVGDELIVNLKLRVLSSTKAESLDNLVVVELLPGGFEVVRDSLSTSLSLAQVNIRDDRVILFLSANSNTQQITFKVKLTARGKFVVPPTYVNSLYNNSVSACTSAGKFEVL
ncbi:MAG: Ig-like domain-containing protein [Deltaproteobacteria bacterium]|jgi:uncharacterized protein YfaS (alpha-2-macroglobulin family)|nr:Ig-like domain-containing protein [Deltaproteobacteria bacterium]